MSPNKIKKRIAELNFILNTDALVEMIKLGQEAESLNNKTQDFKRSEYYFERMKYLEYREKQLKRLSHRNWDKAKLRAEWIQLQYLECENLFIKPHGKNS
jgi:hypothetical protein